MIGSAPRAIAPLLAVLALAAAATGCGEREERAGARPLPLAPERVWHPEARFALPDHAPPPEATIGPETRPVLREISPVTLRYAPRYRVPESGRVSLRPALPPELPEDEPLFLWIRVKSGDRWISLPGRLVSPIREEAGVRVPVDFEVPDAAGGRAGVWVRALAARDAGDAPPEAEAFVVPEGARLDFSVGILEPAWGGGPVEFELSTCEDGACEAVFRERVDPAEADGRGFLDRSVGLQALAGRVVSLRFEALPLGTSGRSLPVWGDPVLLAPRARAPEARSLVLISVDTLRADHVGAYGHVRDTTPFLDQLASQGAVFERYVAAASSTRPSHMTMFTSLAPSVHGATENTGVRTLPPGAATLAELLQRAGIATAAVTENGAIDRSRGFGRGFDVYVEDKGAAAADLRTGAVEETFARGVRWLERVAGRRFFLFLHTYQVHNPFTPPAAYDRFFTEDEGTSPAGLREDWDPVRYDREIRYTDDQIRSLVETLRARGLLDDALLVVTSDHGEAFLEHGFVAHGASVHREVVNVPLIVVGPGVPAGRRLHEPVPMLDLMPTLLDLLDVAGTGAEMGRSQAAAIEGAEEYDATDRPLYSEAWAERAYRARGFELVPQPTLAVRRGSRKLVRTRTDASDPTRFRYELYDLEADPLEQRDLHPSDPDAASDLVRLLLRYEGLAAGLHERLGEAAAGAEGATDPELEEKLRALGYLE